MSRPDRFLGYGRQSITEEDIEAVTQILHSDFLTQGPAVRRFEDALAEYTGARHAVAVSSGTAALHLACLAAGVGEEDASITQPLTFVASANCLYYAGGMALLADIEADSLQMDPEALERTLAENPGVRVVIPVAYGGLSSHMRQLRAVAGKERVIIEDACHALGGRDEEGNPVGSCRHADMTVFSFHPVKPITTAEGGAIMTNDDGLAEELRQLRSHGIRRTASKDAKERPWFYEQRSLGFNYRLSDLQAALGISQLRRLDDFIARRREIAQAYDEVFRELPHVSLVQASPDQRSRSGHHLYVLRIDFQALGMTRGEVMHWLRERNIGTQVHYIPVHYQPWHREQLVRRVGYIPAFPNSEGFYEECLSIPCFPDMSDTEVSWVIEQITRLLEGGVNG